MESNPYEGPKTQVATPLRAAGEAPEETRKKIRRGGYAAVIMGVINLAIFLIFLGDDVGGLQIDYFFLIDVGLIFALAIGIFFRSRVAATIMFVYFLASKIYIMYESGQPQGLLISLIFLYFLYHGMMGSYEFHRWRKEQLEGPGSVAA